MITLNPHILTLKESATLKINQKALQDRSLGKPIVHFGFGQSPFPVPPMMIEELKKQAYQKDYLPTRGLVPLRKQIANYYREKKGYDLNAQEVVIGPGSKELLFQALFILKGDVIIPAPSWVSYGPQVASCGRPVHLIIGEEKHHYKLQAAQLADYCNDKLGEGSKILVLNSPNNPTGAVYSKEEILEIVEVCKDHGIIIISDEIYGDINYYPEQGQGPFAYYPEGVIITGGLSKSHSAGGWRLGFLAASSHREDFLSALSSLISETYSCVSSPIQHAAQIAYSLHPEIEAQITLCSKIHRCTGNYMANRFRQMGVSVSDPKGAFYLFVNFMPLRDALKETYSVETSDRLVEVLYKEIQLAILPGTDFYMPPRFLGARVATVDYDGEAVFKAAQEARSLDHKFVEAHCPRIVEGMNRLEKFFSTVSR